MTREEAIGMLERSGDYVWLLPCEFLCKENSICEALDMAIEALKQVTGKLNNPDDSLLTADSEACKEQKSKLELISRADAIDAIEELPNAYNGWSDAYDKACIIGALEEVPSAEPKTGEWVMLERVENVHDIYGVPTWGVNYMCDNCGFIHTAIQNHFSQYKYCPNCGADMRGEEE